MKEISIKGSLMESYLNFLPNELVRISVSPLCTVSVHSRNHSFDENGWFSPPVSSVGLGTLNNEAVLSFRMASGSLLLLKVPVYRVSDACAFVCAVRELIEKRQRQLYA